MPLWTDDWSNLTHHSVPDVAESKKDQAAEVFPSPSLVYQTEGLEVIWSKSINISQWGTVRDTKGLQKSNKQNYNQIQKLKVKAGKNQTGKWYKYLKIKTCNNASS